MYRISFQMKVFHWDKKDDFHHHWQAIETIFMEKGKCV